MAAELVVDKYFLKTANSVPEKMRVRYGVFLRYDSICAVQPAIDFILKQVPDAEITRHYAEGAEVPAEKCIFSFAGNLKKLCVLETMLLMPIGIACRSAYNAYHMCMECPDFMFLDMHARHACGVEMMHYAAYGCSVGSKEAQRRGAKGFIGTSIDQTAPYHGLTEGLGTMPHVLVGAAGGSVLEAVKLFIEGNPDDRNVVALVDYNGQEYAEMLEVAAWFKQVMTKMDPTYKLSVRLDTHGGRFSEGLTYEESLRIVGKWLHINGEYPITKHVLGPTSFDMVDELTINRVRTILFGKGVSAANLMNMRNVLDAAGHLNVGIVASSGFDLLKCKVMSAARAPINVIGTGSFLPKTTGEMFATCDAFEFNGNFSVKIGREIIFEGLAHPA